MNVRDVREWLALIAAGAVLLFVLTWQPAEAGYYAGVNISTDNDVGFCTDGAYCQTAGLFAGYDMQVDNVYLDFYVRRDERLDSGGTSHNPTRAGATAVWRWK